MKRHLSRLALAMTLGVIAASVLGCGKSAPSTTTAPDLGNRATTPASSAPPVDGPSASAKMICESEAAGEISGRLGVKLSQPLTPTWSDHLYSCRYVYPSGVLAMSVKELADASATTAYYTSMKGSAASQVALTGLGEAAFAVPDGSVFVRKDFKVMHVDVAGLPAQFGQPPRSPADVAKETAAIIMNCWTGS
jgi:hypothetical protein